MKYFLLTVVLLLAGLDSYLGYQRFFPSDQSTEAQTIALQPTLWKLQNQFHLTNVDLDVRVVRKSDMRDPDGRWCECWGRNNGEGYIEIEDFRDMPMSIPWNRRKQFQKEILQHEVMHTVLTDLGVPPQAQDGIIETLRPALVQP